MKKTLLCHFYNEEYMLPWFLNHHKQIFDHGVMIDYHSTDRSVEIIREICPTWDIVTSRNPNFQADTIDYEVMDIEKSIEGWKICLNVTELMIGDYSLMNDNPNQQLLLPSMFYVDCDRERRVDTSIPLYKQKTDGFSFKEGYTFKGRYTENFRERRARSLHNMSVQYPVPGRHYEEYTTSELVIFYYGWCPFDDGALARKLQIQTQIPWVDRQRNWGFHHITNKETLEYRLEHEFIPRSRNIKEDTEYYVNKHENFSNLL
jgi:hypothetical protein